MQDILNYIEDANSVMDKQAGLIKELRATIESMGSKKRKKSKKSKKHKDTPLKKKAALVEVTHSAFSLAGDSSSGRSINNKSIRESEKKLYENLGLI